MEKSIFAPDAGILGIVTDLDRRSHTRICYRAVHPLRGLKMWPWDDDHRHPKGYEAHLQATESEARKQTWFPGAHEDSRREENAREEAGPGTRPPRGEDRLEVIE